MSGPDKFNTGGSACCEAMTAAMRARQIVFLEGGWKVIAPHSDPESEPGHFEALPLKHCPFCGSKITALHCSHRAWNLSGMRCGFPAAMPVSTFCPAHTVANVEYLNRLERANLVMLEKYNEAENITGNILGGQL